MWKGRRGGGGAMKYPWQHGNAWVNVGSTYCINYQIVC